MSEVRRNVPSFSTVTSSFKSYILSLPILTSSVTCVAIFIYILDSLLVNSVIYDAIDLLPKKLFEGQVWRIISYPYPHNSLGHLLFNLLIFLPLSTTIEHTIGTIEYFYILITIFTLLSGAFYLLGSFIFDYKETSVGGLSPWIFGVVVWESRELAGNERDLFGLLRVPAHFYPIVLLLLMEIFFPRAWFASHICSLITGYFYAFGYLSSILPPTRFFSNLESKPPFSRIVNFRGFVKADEISRSGWWLPLSIDPIDDPLESPISENADESGEPGFTFFLIHVGIILITHFFSIFYNLYRFVARSDSLDNSTPLFVVPSSNSSGTTSPSPEMETETTTLATESNYNSNDGGDPLTSNNH
ncbi:9089_t:CDS:2 [Diversispora eburnea]|uniref:rhomboid protease n=1 Tax=Diversispora eburnea TaxID=1213867 RepID=A0A9N9CPM8_9GLOM|nr:9089_t:CDS:2 [Diversispora eburnea]